jgi:hypothetical protein
MNLEEFKIDIKELEKGDKVYSLVHGDLIFQKINSSSIYPVECRRGKQGRSFSFSKDGKERRDEKNPTLLKSNPFLEIKKTETSDVFIPKVMEVSHGGNLWHERYVVFKSEKEGVITASALSQGGFTPTYWKYSREVGSVSKIQEFTIEELAKLAGFDPELIRLKS